MKSPVFAHGRMENVRRAIDGGTLQYPSYIWIDDTDQYAFLNKYGELEICGIPQLVGTSQDQIIVSLLDDGLYEIKGNHKITADDPTTFLSASYVLCIVQTIDEKKKVKRITADEIADYVIEEDLTVTKDTIVTEKYLEQQGYADKAYLDAKIAVLKLEIENEIEVLVEPVIEPIVDRLLDLKLQPVDNESIQELFE